MMFNNKPAGLSDDLTKALDFAPIRQMIIDEASMVSSYSWSSYELTSLFERTRAVLVIASEDATR